MPLFLTTTKANVHVAKCDCSQCKSLLGLLLLKVLGLKAAEFSLQQCVVLDELFLGFAKLFYLLAKVLVRLLDDARLAYPLFLELPQLLGARQHDGEVVPERHAVVSQQLLKAHTSAQHTAQQTHDST